ncbi:hypothetical protein ACF1BS_03415 [Streptomyces sp. NPDC014748]|uniref:hypothetical protein n=1 Tax=Streptomyces sp. NPDC014748 TaxID=3364905 RepID=UPI0036FCC814
MPKPTQAQIDEYAAENELLAAYRRAEAALYENAAAEARAGITHETPEFLRLNQAVIDAEKKLPKRLRKG